MKVNITFDLDNNETDDNINYKIYSQSMEMYCVLFDMLEHLRYKIKYSDNEDEIKYAEETRTVLLEKINENNIKNFY